MEPLITIAVTFVLIVSFYFIVMSKPKGSKSLKLPPGPPKLPIIGNVHQMAGAQPHHAFRDLAKQYGPIMHVKLGQISTIVLSSPQLAEEALRTNDIALANRPYFLLADILLYGTSDVVFGAYGEYWRQMKKIITLEALSAKKVRSFGRFREQEFIGFIEFVRSKRGQPVTLRERLTKTVNNVTCKSLFGNSCKQQEVLIEVIDEIGRLLTAFTIADLFPDFRFLPVITGMKSSLIKVHKTLDKILEEIFEERKTRRAESGPSDDDLLDVLLNIKEGGGLQFPITDNNIKAIFINMFTGGTDTSVLTIEWAMTEMFRNPRVMEKAQAEVREAFKGKDTKTITETDLKGLAYLKLVIKETLRVHPPVPLLVPRECRQECQIGGYDIPVKTKVMVNAFSIGTDPQYWGDDAESFKPERFENSSIEFLGTNYEYLPFGSGRRICPGINFALASVEMGLAQILYHFDWQLPAGLRGQDIDMSENRGIISIKRIPLELIPTPYSPI